MERKAGRNKRKNMKARYDVKKRMTALIICWSILLTGTGFTYVEENAPEIEAQMTEELQEENGNTEQQAEVQNIDEVQNADAAQNTAGGQDAVETQANDVSQQSVETQEVVETQNIQTAPILSYEDKEEKITVTVEGNLPASAVSLTAKHLEAESEEKEIKDAYEEVLTELQKYTEDTEAEWKGFLAYDISLLDANGQEVEPEGEVKVTVSHETPVTPEGVDVTDTEITMLHLEKNEQGEVTVKDLGEDEKLKTKTAEGNALQESVFTTESFSYYVETWMAKASGLSTLEEAGETIPDITGYKVEIKDDVKYSGDLQVVMKDADRNEVTDTTGITVTWQKSVNGGAFATVDKTVYTNGDTNIDEEKHTLNIALDGGALNSKNGQTSVKYKAVIHAGDVEKTSGEYNVTYWNELRNGGFETPLVTGSYNHQFSNEAYKNQGGVWQTTGLGTGNKVGHDIEITSFYGDTPAKIQEYKNLIKRDQNVGGYNWAGEVEDAEGGYQFAELNCEAEGALYQDVSTLKGVEMHYGLSHRARGWYTDRTESDTMYLVIMPTKYAEDGIEGISTGAIDTQVEVRKLIDAKQANSSLYEDVFVRKITSDDQAWHSYTGTYVPNSNLTRFFFVAGARNEIASNNNTVGNFLDAVYFSQELPKPKEGECQYQVVKRVVGLDIQDEDTAKEVLKGLTFKIEITKQNGEIVEKTVKGSDMGWRKNADGTFVGSVLYSQKIKSGETYQIEVTESGTTITGAGACTSEYKTGETYTSGTVASTTVKSGETAVVEFKNTYEKVEKNTDESQMKVVKTFDGLTEEGVNKLKDNFAIKLYEADQPGTVWKTLKLKDAVKSADGLTYTWTIEGATSTKYYVEETGATLSTGNGKLTAEINGANLELGEKTKTSVQAVTAEITEIRNQKIPSSGPKALSYIDTNNNNFFVVKLGDGSYMIWTEDRLSLNERQALRKAIAESGRVPSDDPVRGVNGENAKVIFYSGLKNLECYGTVEHNGNRFNFTNINTAMWQSTTHGKYEITEQKPEIQVTNRYTVDVDLQKFGSTYEMNQLTGATFSMIKGEQTNAGINWNLTPDTQYNNFPVTEEAIELQNLSNGIYKLTETKAPEGYQKLSESIYFKVKDGVVTLTDANGNSDGLSESTMWELKIETGSDGSITIKIKNNALYDLPSTGGVGIYWYVIGGTVIMMLCLLLIYRRKGDEVI